MYASDLFKSRLVVDPVDTFEVTTVMLSSLTITSLAGLNIWVGSDAMLITENVSLSYVATHHPYPSHLRENRLVVVLSCAVVPMINVLLRILPGELDVVVWLPHMVRACLAGMSVGYVKTA